MASSCCGRRLEKTPGTPQPSPARLGLQARGPGPHGSPRDPSRLPERHPHQMSADSTSLDSTLAPRRSSSNGIDNTRLLESASPRSTREAVEKALGDISALGERQQQYHQRMDSQAREAIDRCVAEVAVLGKRQLQHQHTLDAIREQLERLASGFSAQKSQSVGGVDASAQMPQKPAELPEFGVLREQMSRLAERLDGQQVCLESLASRLPASQDAAAEPPVSLERSDHMAKPENQTVVPKKMERARGGFGPDLIGAYCGQRFHEGLGNGEGAVWNNRRLEVLSEFSFNPKAFAKAVLYECLPEIVGGLVCMAVDSKGQSKARALWPWNPAKDLMTIGGCWVMLLLTFFHKPESVNMYDSISIMLFVAVRAATVGCKYATYGDFANKQFQNSEVYSESKKVLSLTMAGHILNMFGGKKPVLLEQLYASQLRRDSDLTCVNFRLDSEEAAQKMWAEVEKDLVEVHAITLSKELGLSRNTKMGSIVSAATKDGGLPPLSDIWLHSKFEENGSGVVAEMFRSTITENKEAASRREISGFVFAAHCVFRCHGNSKTQGKFVFRSCLVWSMMVAAIPSIVNVIMGLPPFGATRWAMAVLILQTWFFCPLFMLMVYYVIAPCMFFAFQMRVEMYLNGCIADGLHRKYPAVNLRIPENVIAWAAAWRVLHGPNFSSTFQYRSQFYLVLSFGAIVMDAALQAAAFQADPDNLPLSSKIQSFVRLLTMAIVVCMEIVLAHAINCYAAKNTAEVERLQRQIGAMLECDPCDEEKEQLERSLALLGHLAEEISAEEASRPVCVGFLRGDIARLSTVGTLLAALMYSDLLILRSKLGMESGGFPF